MPVVLKPEAWPLWLGEEPADTSALKALLTPFPSDGMICWPVNARVGLPGKLSDLIGQQKTEEGRPFGTVHLLWWTPARL
jgi:putative SOS response-associated peptidase YedK